MTEKITLELTLDELKLIDKYIEYHDYDCDKPLLDKIRNAYPKPDVIEIGGVKYQRIEEPHPKPMDEVVDRLIKKYQAQKLWNRVRDELGYSIDCCDSIVDLVESWLPEPQSAAGSQNVDVEFLVDGFNDCVRKMKEMLR
jgi:hypothetical protein